MKADSMKKKEYLLKDRIIRAILLAVLAQSLLFGIILFSAGGFSALARQPYETMRMRLEDKCSVLTGTLNHVYLEGERLKRQIRSSTETKDVHTMLVDTLNRSDISAIIYMSTRENRGVYYEDAEPQEYSMTASDISCVTGDSLSDTKVSLSNKWKKNFKSYMQMQGFLSGIGRADGWFYDSTGGLFYYVLHVEDQTGPNLIFMQVQEERLYSQLEENQDETGTMHFCLGNTDGTFYRGTAKAKPAPVSVSGAEKDGMEAIVWNDGKEDYTGYRKRIGMYGNFYGDRALYAEVLSRKSLVQAPVVEMIWKIAAAYLFSITACLLVCWRATVAVLKPLQGLQEDIQRQKGNRINFQESRIGEIQDIYDALYDMTKRLEESNSRYDFAMEEVEQSVGSFVWIKETGLTSMSRSARRILCIPPDMLAGEDELKEGVWGKIRAGLTPFPELNGHTFQDGEGKVHCVSIKTKEEENGIFGVVTDKTAAYEKLLQFKWESEHDHLTGLYNGAYMKKEGDELLRKYHDKVNAMLFCDLDNLKYVNDNYGHAAGDSYIMAMGDRLRRCADRIVKENGDVEIIAARMSGDEFALLFAGFDDRETVIEAVRGIYRQECVIRLPDGGEYAVHASGGLVFGADASKNTVERLLCCADIAMYTVKSGCKNCAALYLDDDHARSITGEEEAQEGP